MAIRDGGRGRSMHTSATWAYGHGSSMHTSALRGDRAWKQPKWLTSRAVQGSTWQDQNGQGVGRKRPGAGARWPPLAQEAAHNQQGGAAAGAFLGVAW